MYNLSLCHGYRAYSSVSVFPRNAEMIIHSHAHHTAIVISVKMMIV